MSTSTQVKKRHRAKQYMWFIKSFRVWLIYLGITSLLAVNTWILSSSFKQANEHETWTNRTAHSFFLVEQITSASREAAMIARDYAATKRKDSLIAYQQVRMQITENLNELIELNNNHPNNQSFLRFKLLIEKKLSTMSGSIAGFIEQGQKIKSIQRNDLDTYREQSARRQNVFFWVLLGGSGISWLLLTFSIFQINRNIKRNNQDIKEKEQLEWLKKHLTEIDMISSGELSPKEIAKVILHYLSSIPFVAVGRFYLIDDDKFQECLDDGTTSFPTNPSHGSLIREASKKDSLWVIKNVPENYWAISSGFGAATPRSLMFLPLTFKSRPLALIEIATFEDFTQRYIDLFRGVREIVSANLNISQSRERQKVLLDKTLILAKELQAQKEELGTANTELASQARVLELHQDSLSLRNNQLEQARKELESKAAALEKSNTFKSEFLTKISHELRTPLNGVLLLSNLLIENKDENLNQRQIQFAQSINNAGNDLLLLINDILDLSKIEANKLALHIEKFELTDFVDQIQKSFIQQALIKGVELRTEVDDSFKGHHLETDKQRLEQILRNFISNALKFTPKGHITIKVEKSESSENIKISVIDTGIGIPEDKKEIIFKAFEQADGSICREYGGTGLGLTISLELASLIGGTITTDSAVGIGSTFSIEVPERKIEHSNLPVKKIPDSIKEIAPQIISNGIDQRALFYGKKVLLVDDDVRNIFALTSVLESEGLRVQVARNGQEALKLLNKASGINLVLMDIMMPVMDGYETIKRIRSKRSKRISQVPIIALTAKVMKSDIEMCIDVGANDYLPKPVVLSNLMKKISTCIQEG